MRRNKLRRDERGFTLPEVLVTILILIVVLFALYSIFDMGIRIFAFGNDKLEATENARLGLERMEREIRAAFPHDASDDESDNDYLFFSTSGPGTATAAMPTETQITFGNELNGDEKIDCPNPAGVCEYITYKLSPADLANPGATRTLQKVNTDNSDGAGQPVVEFVEPDGLTFEYFESDGSEVLDNDPSKIYRIRITLDIRVEGGQQDGTQTLTTDVTLRNRQ